MPRSPQSSYTAIDTRSSAPSQADSLYAERIASPPFPSNVHKPPPLTTPLDSSSARHSKQLDSINNDTENGSNGVFNSISRALQSTVGAAEGLHASFNHSFNHSFSRPPLGVTLDEEQRRCVNTAFHISFHGNPRVKHKSTCVGLPNGASFLIVDRFVSGNSDGVYEKNRKIWEHIPVGQARVFARAANAAKDSTDVANHGMGGGDGGGGEDGDLPAQGTLRLNEEPAAAMANSAQRSSQLHGTSHALQSFPHSPVAATPATAASASSSPTPQTCTTAHGNAEWTCVATTVGLRKMGHWREATTVYATHKAVAKSAIALEKIDGESGQVSAFTWMGERYWVVGCGYQHIVTRLDVPEADLVRYTTAASTTASSSSSSSALFAPDELLTNEGAMLASPSVQSPTGYTHNSGDASRRNNSSCTSATAHDHEVHSTHSGSMTTVTTLASGGLTSEAGYLDLAVRMARLWRRVLESLPNEEEELELKEGVVAATAEKKEESARSALATLHSRVAADKRSLCFGAILTGWERLQAFSALHSFTPDDSSAGTTTPVSSSSSSSSCSPDTPQVAAAASAVFASPSPTPSMWEAEIPLWFYAVTWDAPLEVRGWCMPVRRARDFFHASHLPFVPTSEAVELGSPAYEALRQSVLSRCDTAGAVLYGSSADVGDEGEDAAAAAAGESVVQVWKCRAYPHTLERVVQEYVVTHRLCGDPLRNKMKKKVSSLPHETRLCIKQWELHRLPFLVDFALWLHREKYITPSTDLAALKNIRGHWLSYQERFKDVLLAQLQRQQQRLSARHSSLSTLDVSHKEERRGDDASSAVTSAEEEDSVDPIMLVGPQGCGKSTMARVLYALLEEAGAAPRWLNQDEVGTRTAYLAAIRRAMARGTYSHLLLDKMNLDDKARADYAEIGVKPVLVVAWRHAGGTEAMVNTCFDRVMQRGACHRTFFHAAETSRGGQLSSVLTSSRSPELRPTAEAGAEVGSAAFAASPISVLSPSALPALSLSTDAAARPQASPVSSPSSSTNRLHGILEASAKRYQVPSNLSCVELDVMWDCQHAVSLVWEALRDKGTYELPPLSELNVEQALQSAYAYERLLAAYPTRVAAAVLRGPPSETVLQMLGTCRPPTIPKTQQLQPQVEVVLHDFQLNPSPTALVHYASQIGTSRRLTIQAVVSNSKVVLLLVLGPSESVAAAANRNSSSNNSALQMTGGGASSGGDGSSRPMPGGVSSSTLAGVDVATASPTDSPDLYSYLESQAQQEQWAVVAKAKKVTVEYCEGLAQRVRDDPEEDPYCTVRWLSPPLTVDFAVCFTFP